ncbi:MAG: 50S ribosomal protein L20 [Solirubrobacterales bacterium]
MSRVKRATHSAKKRRETLARVKGHRHPTRSSYRLAKQAELRAGQFAYRDRRVRKREFRKLWITRINAASRREGMSYSQLMHGLKLAEVQVDRKILADIAVHDADGFRRFVELAREAAEA